VRFTASHSITHWLSAHNNLKATTTAKREEAVVKSAKRGTQCSVKKYLPGRRSNAQVIIARADRAWARLTGDNSAARLV